MRKGLILSEFTTEGYDVCLMESAYSYGIWNPDNDEDWEDWDLAVSIQTEKIWEATETCEVILPMEYLT